MATGNDVATDPQPLWHAVWTHSNCEQLVYEQLAAKGYHPFLPTVRDWTTPACRGRRRLPMFPGYLFTHDFVDKTAFIEIMRTRGLVTILGRRWDRLAVVQDSEVEAIKRIAAAEIPSVPHAYLRSGSRVRVVEGALKGVEGFLLQIKQRSSQLVVSIDLFQRSVAVRIAADQVVSA